MCKTVILLLCCHAPSGLCTLVAFLLLHDPCMLLASGAPAQPSHLADCLCMDVMTAPQKQSVKINLQVIQFLPQTCLHRGIGTLAGSLAGRLCPFLLPLFTLDVLSDCKPC